MLRTWWRVLVQCWPVLLAWFLAGWIARTLIVNFAGYLGNSSSILGLLVLPIGILAQLAAFVGMFLAARRALPHLHRVDEALESDGGGDRFKAAREWTDALLSGILPFFLLYVAWGLIRDDFQDYSAAALQQLDFGAEGGGNANAVPVSVMSITLVLVAFAARWLLGRFRDRLPAWVSGAAVYLEAVWVLIALLVIQGLLEPVPDWLASRRMFAWGVDLWAGIVDSLPWLQPVGDALGWLLGQVGTLIGLPLAWLAFAAIVFVRTSANASPDERLAGLRRRWRRLPRWSRQVALRAAAGVLERWQPVVDAARLIAGAGILMLATYLLAFAVTQVSGEWLTFAAYRSLGPHEVGWWFGASDGIALGAATVVAVLQFSLIAAAFDASVERSTRGDSAAEESSTANSSTSPAGTR